MSKKLKTLIFINLLLLTAIILSLTLPNANRKQTSSEASNILFANLPLDSLDRLKIGTHQIAISTDNVWKVDNDYVARPSQVNTILGILSRLEIKRTINAETLQQFLRDSTTYQVEVFADDLSLAKFTLGQAGSETWLATSENKGYYVYVPGLFFDANDYFQISENRWRDRRILRTSWQTLQQLSVTYTGDPANSFTISFDSTFYTVSGVTQLDSAAVYNYIQLYEQFEVSQFVDNPSISDSLSTITPLCEMEVKDLRASLGGKLRLYPGPKGVFGELLPNGEIVAFNPQQLRTFLVSKEFFMRQ